MEQFTNQPETNHYFSSLTTDEFIAEDASTGQRFVNFLIDLVAMYIFSYGAGVIVVLFIFASGAADVNSGQPSPAVTFLLMFVMICFSVFFYAFSEGVSGGRSIGKLITGTKAVKI